MAATIAPPASTHDPLGLDDSSTARTMRAVVQQAYGGADRLSMTGIDLPGIGASEVLVQVQAAGLDRGTWHVMRGEPYVARLALGLRAPKVPVPGRDLAGIVVATGRDVTRFRLGDEVFGIGNGSFAEFAAAREDKLAPKPSGIGFEQAAVVPVSGLTALQGLTKVGRLQAGQRVLITGASGGVGSYAVQIAKALGAEVTGVCSAAKMAFVRSLGADQVLDYAATDIADGSATYDLILDIGGSTPVRKLRRVLTTRGTLVIVGAEGGDRVFGLGRQLRAVMLSPFVKQRLTMMISSENATDLGRLAEMLAEGSITPRIDRTYPLSDVPAAMRRLEAGQVSGKLAIVI